METIITRDVSIPRLGFGTFRMTRATSGRPSRPTRTR
jgi:hypothetical protein